MDAKLKKKWVKALRGGKYKQGEHDLYHNRTYCCLGVLARVQGASVSGDCLKINGTDVRKPTRTGKSKQEYLAPSFAAGLHAKSQQRLGSMNDGTGTYLGQRRDFKQIADFIEKNY